jgi:hypothetical protein
VTQGSSKTDYQIQASDAPSKDTSLVHFNKVLRDVERYRKVFGVPLKVLLKREKESDIPTIVEKSIKFIYDYGMCLRLSLWCYGSFTNPTHLHRRQ